MDHPPTLEECLLPVLIALARHSPTKVTAILRFPRLIGNVIRIFTRLGTSKISSQIKVTVLLKVLSPSDKQICSDFVNRGVFRKATWQLYRSAITLEHWIESGKDHSMFDSPGLNTEIKGVADIMIERLRALSPKVEGKIVAVDSRWKF